MGTDFAVVNESSPLAVLTPDEELSLHFRGFSGALMTGSFLTFSFDFHSPFVADVTNP